MDRLSPFQASVLATPESANLALLGARGGGKTIAGVALAVRHLAEHGEGAHVLIVRRTLRALSEFEDELLRLVGVHSLGMHEYNKAEKILRWSGGTITLAAIEQPRDYDKLQGKSFTLLIVDEVTQYGTERLLRLLRSNLRAAPGVPTRVVYLGNPGGPLHARIFERHVKDRASHVPYTLPVADDGDEAEAWITIFSGPADNPFIDRDAYVRRLREACHGDPVRLRQWLFGEWEVGSGRMFDMFDPDVHLLRLTDDFQISEDQFAPFTSIDWGLSSPSVALIGGRARRSLDIDGRRPAPAGSLFVFDEVTDAIFDNPEDLSRSREWSPARLGERVVNRAADLGVQRVSGVVDSARGLRGESLHLEMRAEGFGSLTPPRKGSRAEGHALLRSMLTAAAERDPSRPHLYISDRCRYVLATLPNVVRDEADPDDIADTPSCPDHGIDALRYLSTWARRLKPITWQPLNVY